MADAPKILGTDTLRQAYPKLNTAMDLLNGFQDQLNTIVIDGDSSLESAQARIKVDGTTFTTLKERLDSSDAALAEKAKQSDVRLKAVKLSQNDMTEEFLQQMAGTTPINAVPANKSIGKVKMEDSLVELLKGDLLVYAQNKNNYDTMTTGFYIGDGGTPVVSSGHRYSDFIEVEKGKTYVFNSVFGINHSAVIYDANNNFIAVLYKNFLTTNAEGKLLYTAGSTSNGVAVFDGNVKYIRINTTNDQTGTMFVEGTVYPLTYLPYKDELYSTKLKNAVSNMIPTVPTKTSQLTNDSGFVSNKVAVISCWGDSKTAGNQDGTGVTYPKVLQDLLTANGYSYTVNNMGVGGEYTTGIAGRQGGLPLTVQPFTIPAGTTPVQVTISSTGRIAQQGVAGLNPVIINGVEGTLSYDWTNLYNTFTRSVAGSSVSVTRPSQVITKAMRSNRNDILIIDMGTNGGFGTVDEWIKQIRCMVDYAQCKEFIVIGRNIENENPVFKNSVIEPEFKKAFGNRYINLREYEVAYGLQDVGITPTTADNTAIASGQVPPSLLFDAVHENQYGYTIKGQQAFKKLQELQIITK
jgi:hypothetical protein